jgi:hypothetical protein
MKAVRTTLILLLFVALSFPAFASGGRSGGGHRASHFTRFHTSGDAHTSHASRKPHASGSHDGNYQSGHGSSHKGGHYKNKKTGDHYRDRKRGTPQ